MERNIANYLWDKNYTYLISESDSEEEVQNAEEEGIEFVWLTSPSKFNGNNKVDSVEVNKIRLGDPDDSGRRKPIIQKNSEFEVSIWSFEYEIFIRNF